MRLARTLPSDTAHTRETELGGTDILLHFDAGWRLLAVAIADASLHLPPAACVPGAMDQLMIRYGEEDDVMQVMFQNDPPIGRLDGYRAVVGAGREGSPALVIARETSGQVVALVMEGASALGHSSLLEAAS